VASASPAKTGRRSVLARSRRLLLAGAAVETPLLVPAMSSKALGPIELRQSGSAELVPASLVHSEAFLSGIDEALLISAYDVHFNYLTDADRFRSGFASSAYAGLKLLMIDSGWYEKSVGPASGNWYHEVGPPQPFEEDDFVRLVDDLDADVRAVVVSWDHAGTYEEQIDAAQAFFGAKGRDRFSSSILLKPQGRRQHLDLSEVSSAVAGRLRAFDVVGVTEKELGDSFVKRLTTLARLRILLDEASVDAPIHVFGGLDPLLTPLYFAAGAEIFDGLSWLRYAFSDGQIISRESLPLIQGHYAKRFSLAVAHVQLQNLDEIRDLSGGLKVFLHQSLDWSKLRRGEMLRPAFEAMESALGGSGGR
jgi:hypothetical protein